MGAFEYLSVLISIILALGMTRVLAGVGEMLQARSRHRIYWVHVMWIVNLFLYLVIAWRIFYRWRDQQPWNFYLFLFVLISPTILYLASLLLFPREGGVETAIDYKAHYYANHRAFFITFSHSSSRFGILLTRCLKGVPHFLALGPAYFISGVLYFAGLMTAAITRSERYHEFYAVFFFLQTACVSFLIFQTLV